MKRQRLRSMRTILSREQYAVVQLIFVDEMTQAEVGHAIGMSQQDVSVVLRQALRRLRDAKAFVVDFDPPK